MKMKQFKIVSFILSVIIVCNTFCYSIAYASDSEIDAETLKKMKEFEDARDNQDKWKQMENSVWTWILSQGGALFHGDMKQIRENNEQVNKELRETWDNPQWRKDNIKIITGNGTPKLQLTKEVSQLVLDTTKKANKEPENGGYELLKTVPASKISNLYFDYSMATASMFNLLKDNNGILGLYCYYGSPYFYKIPENVFYVKGTWKYNGSITGYKDHELDCVTVYKNLTGGSVSLYPLTPTDDSTAVTSWDSGLRSGIDGRRAYNFKLYDTFSFLVDAKKGINPLMENQCYFLVTNSGVSIPVFNTIDDAVAYSVANNLYYTGSDYTGVGTEIVIEFKEVENITNGYYDDMYKLLQQMIENQGGNSLTPEQLQQIVDEVRASFGLLKNEINKGFEQQDILIQKNSSILQNIADALNEFFRQTKLYRESMDKMLRDFINGQKYIPPNASPDDGLSNGTGDSDNKNWLEQINESINIHIENFEDFASDCLSAIKNIQNGTGGGSKIPSLPSPGGGGDWDFLEFLMDIAKDIAGGAIDEGAQKVGSLISEILSGLGECFDMLSEVFPFSIPWDIAILVGALAREPETPYFEIPVVMEKYGINEKIVIDLSDFEYVSKISRSFLTLIWAMYLMNFTVKFTDTKNI